MAEKCFRPTLIDEQVEVVTYVPLPSYEGSYLTRKQLDIVIEWITGIHSQLYNANTSNAVHIWIVNTTIYTTIV